MNLNSLSNLIPGGKPRKPENIPDTSRKNLVRYLKNNEKLFLTRLSELNDKDFINVYVELLTLVTSTTTDTE